MRELIDAFTNYGSNTPEAFSRLHVYITVFVEVAPKRQRPNDSKAKAASVAPTAPPKFSAEAVLQKRRDKNAAQMVRGHFRKVSSKDGRAAFESFQKQLEDPDNAGE